MGTVVTIDVYTRPGTAPSDLAAVPRQLRQGVAILHRADEVFSTWLPAARSAGSGAVNSRRTTRRPKSPR